MMDPEKEKRFRFRARLEAEMGAQRTQARRPSGTQEDPFTSTEQLTNRYPGNPEASRLYANAPAQEQKVREGQQKAYKDAAGPIGRAVAGTGRFAYGFVPGEKAQAERAVFDAASAGDIPTMAGRIAPEIGAAMAGGAGVANLSRAGLIASPALRAAATGAAYGLPSTAMHQAQSLAAGKGFNPVSAGVEMGVSAALPAGGAAVGQFLRNRAPDVLRSAVKPVLAQMDTPNPPNFEAALERGVVPYFGGTGRAAENARQVVQGIGRNRDAAARAASTQNGQTVRSVPFIGGALHDARREIARINRAPGSQMLAADRHAANEALNFWTQEFRGRTTANRPGFMSVEDALGFRQRIDETINWRRVNQQLTPGFERASLALRQSINNWIERRAPEVARQTGELAGILPVTQALERRALQEGNNYRMGLLDLGALSTGGLVGGMAGGGGGAGAGTAAALGLLAARRLTSTPGGAAMMYDLGTSLSNPSALRGLLMQTGRSAANDVLRDY